MSTLCEYRERVGHLSRREVSKERADLFKTMNGDAFFPLKSWPEDLQMAFWQKPIGDHIQADAILFRGRLFPNLDLRVDSTLTNLGARRSRRKKKHVVLLRP